MGPDRPIPGKIGRFLEQGVYRGMGPASWDWRAGGKGDQGGEAGKVAELVPLLADSDGSATM